MSQRIRNNRLNIYLNDDEYRSFLEKVQTSGLSMSSFCRQLFEKGEVKAAPPADFRKLTWELKRIGTNLDQVLFKMNTIGECDQDSLQECISEINGAIKMLYQVFNHPGGN